jgi:hypothetical protein
VVDSDGLIRATRMDAPTGRANNWGDPSSRFAGSLKAGAVPDRRPQIAVSALEMTIWI